jgi:hypothetical protein
MERARGREPAAGVDPEAARRGLPLLPAGLMIAVGSLVVMGVWHGLTDRQPDESGVPPGAADAAPTAPIEAGGAFTSRPSVAGPATGADGGAHIAGMLPQAGRAELLFLDNEQESLPRGGLRVHGRVRNAGGAPARQARVRVRVLLENGEVAAQSETPLSPATLAGGQIASFDLLLDYAGPSATIRSELIWSE